jgi:hypothetical protein
MIRRGWIGLSGTKALAYFPSSSVTKEKGFTTLSASVNHIKHFFYQLAKILKTVTEIVPTLE